MNFIMKIVLDISSKQTNHPFVSLINMQSYLVKFDILCGIFSLRGLWIKPNSSTPSTEFHNGDEEGNFLELPKNNGQQQKRNDGVKAGALAVSYAVLHLEQEKQQ